MNLDASKEPSRDRLRRPPGPCLSADAKDVRQRQTDVWFELLSPQPELENLNLHSPGAVHDFEGHHHHRCLDAMVLIFAATKPKTFRLQRYISIAAPRERVFTRIAVGVTEWRWTFSTTTSSVTAHSGSR